MKKLLFSLCLLVLTGCGPALSYKDYEDRVKGCVDRGLTYDTWTNLQRMPTNVMCVDSKGYRFSTKEE